MRYFICAIILLSTICTIASDIKSPTIQQRNKKWWHRKKRSPKNKFKKNSPPRALIIDTKDTGHDNEHKHNPLSSPRSPNGAPTESGSLKNLHKSKSTKNTPHSPLPSIYEYAEEPQTSHNTQKLSPKKNILLPVTVTADSRVVKVATLNNLLLLCASQNSPQALDGVAALLHARADVEVTDTHSKKTPLMLAAEVVSTNDPDKNISASLYSMVIVQLLQNAGASTAMLDKNLSKKIARNITSYRTSHKNLEPYYAMAFSPAQEAAAPQRIMVAIENLPPGFVDCMQQFDRLRVPLIPQSLHMESKEAHQATTEHKHHRPEHISLPNAD